MSNGVVKYPFPSDFQDPYAGFRQELGDIEKKQQESQEKALKMASMIEMADSSTMFGGDYSYANKWAQHLTENLDDFASSTEGMIQFQQATQQLANFIDGSEAYKKENFGTVKDGPQAGSFQGQVMRGVMGDDFQFEGDLVDERTKEEYEMEFLRLNQEASIDGFQNGLPSNLGDYNQSRPQNPFMPRLKEANIMMGSTWYSKKGPNKSHETIDEAKEWTRNSIETTPKLQRQAARDYQRTQREEGKDLSVEEILNDVNHREQAYSDWVNDAANSWIDPKLKEKQAKPTAAASKRANNLSALLGSVVDLPSEDVVAEIPRISTGGVEEINLGRSKGQLVFSPQELSEKIDITAFVDESMRTKEVKNPAFDEFSDEPEFLETSIDVKVSPGQISVREDGVIILSGMGNFEDQAIGDIEVDPSSMEGRKLMGALNADFITSYGVSFSEFTKQLGLSSEVPEQVGFDPNSY